MRGGATDAKGRNSISDSWRGYLIVDIVRFVEGIGGQVKTEGYY